MHKLITAGISLIVLSASCGSALAAGFALFEHSVKGLGTAFSAPAATAYDPSTVFFNPAGMTRLEGRQAKAALPIVVPRIEFDGSQAENVNVLGRSLGDNEGGDAGVVKAVPSAFLTANSGGAWAFGIGVNAPFGLATSYDRGWVGRYHSVESDVLTVNINPSVAYRVNDSLSLGAGVSAQYIDVLLSQMVDFGLLAAPGTLDSNPDADVFAELTADDWSFGYNLGMLYEFTPDTRVGLAYRSRIRHELEGDAKFEIQNPAFLTSIPVPSLPGATLLDVARTMFPDQGVRGNVELPANAELSIFHRLNDRWAVMADLQWTGWSTYDKLIVNFDGTLAASPDITTENWNDSWRYAAGAIFNPTREWSLRGGLCFDETPIPDAEHRSPRLPGEDRVWVTVGAGYEAGPWSFDVGYSHVFIKDARINKIAAPGNENAAKGSLVGEFEFNVDVIGAEATYRF